MVGGPWWDGKWQQIIGWIGYDMMGYGIGWGDLGMVGWICFSVPSKRLVDARLSW